jgi:hypothetical protein
MSLSSRSLRRGQPRQNASAFNYGIDHPGNAQIGRELACLRRAKPLGVTMAVEHELMDGLSDLRRQVFYRRDQGKYVAVSHTWSQSVSQSRGHFADIT